MPILRTRPPRALKTVSRLPAVLAVALIGVLATASSDSPRAQMGTPKGPGMMVPRGSNLVMPTLNPARGRKLFASKGCVVCHAINGIGGTLGPSLDAARSVPYASAFDFAARMWRGADAMITLQEAELGYQIDLDGEALADITAFAHDIEEQSKFSIDDIPPAVVRMMKLRRL